MMQRGVDRFQCSRMFAIATGIVLVIMGIISLAISIWMLTSDNWAIIFSYQINILCTFMIVAACIMILGGIYGTWAAYASRNNHLSGYYGVAILSALLLMVCGVLAISLPLRVKVAGCGAPAYPIIAGINATATQALQWICQTPCQCYYNGSTTSVNMTTYIISSTINTLPIRAQNCTGWVPTPYDELMGTIQKSFSCAGWCPGTKGNIYLMTDVNAGIPSKACFDATLQWFISFCKTIGICAFVFAGVIVLIVALIWWHLCQLVDSETYRILILTGKMPPPPPYLSRSGSFQMTQMHLPVQPLSQVSQPASPRQIYQQFPPNMAMQPSPIGYPIAQNLPYTVAQSRTFGSPR